MPLKIHFLNVGHGDCTIIEHPSGRVTMVDINNGSLLDDKSADELFGDEYKGYALMNSIQTLLGHQHSARQDSLAEFATKKYDIKLTNPVDYFKRQIKDPYGNLRKVWRFISTHPHTDHLCGLECLASSGIDVLNFWDTANSRMITEFKSDGERAAWEAYQSYRKGDGGHRVLTLARGSKGPMYNQEELGSVDGGDVVTILAPTPTLTASAEGKQDWNMHSYVLAVCHAGKFVILGGDAEEETWKSIHEFYGDNLKCAVLGASHHGRDSGYYQPAVKAMSPDYTIVSVGKKPTTDAHGKYNNYSGKVMSTRWYGNIVVTISDSGIVTVTPEKDRDAEALRALVNMGNGPGLRIF